VDARQVANSLGRLIVVGTVSTAVLFGCVLLLTGAGVGIFWATVIGAVATVITAAGLVLWTERFQA
jgi:putative flippase GtrA